MEYGMSRAEEKKGMALIAVICLAFIAGMVNEFAGIAVVAVGLLTVYIISKTLGYEDSDFEDDQDTLKERKGFAA